MIVLTDEAHRSQYDTLALNMRAALPNALFLAFTGTPLIAGEERTREVFGDYVSIYDFQQSVEDGATVPLFYENRTPELQLVNPNLNDDIYDLDRSGGARRGAGERAGTGARPAVPPHHPRRPAGDGREGHRAALPRARLPGQGDGGVHRQGHRAADVRQGAEALAGGTRAGRDGAGDGCTTYGTKLDPDAVADLKQRLDVLTTTDMAVIVSPGQNEIEQMKTARPRHRAAPQADERRGAGREVQGPGRPAAAGLRLRDVAHRLRRAELLDDLSRQADAESHADADHRAREPRVPGKHSGLIVDYANVFASLEKALAIYGARAGRRDAGARQDRSSWRICARRWRRPMAFCRAHGVRLRRRSKQLPPGVWSV